MAHLACKTHGRRVVVFRLTFDTDAFAVHRNGDGSPCADRVVMIGDKPLAVSRIPVSVVISKR